MRGKEKLKPCIGNQIISGCRVDVLSRSPIIYETHRYSSEPCYDRFMPSLSLMFELNGSIAGMARFSALEFALMKLVQRCKLHHVAAHVKGFRLVPLSDIT